jgi:dethiobiotin synthetase
VERGVSALGLALPSIVFVTGTDTNVGKTIATAALAAALAGQQKTVAVYKPTQTGATPDDIADIDTIRQLSGIETGMEGVRLPDPMAPVAAAARRGMTLPRLAEHINRIDELANDHNHVLVEGAGGLLVDIDAQRGTLADLATAFGRRASMIIVCRSGLGTLNHTHLTLDALRYRGIPIAGLIIGSWPEQPDDIDVSNRHHLASLAVPLIAAIPEHAARLPTQSFRMLAMQWLPTMDQRSR